MKLGPRVIGLLVGLTAVLLCALFVVAHVVVSRGFSRIEHDLAVGNARHVLHAIRVRAEDLDASVADWARWDATYRFVRDGNSGFRAENLAVSTFTGLKIDLLLIADLRGSVVWGGVSSPPGSPISSPSDEERGLVAPGSGLTRFSAGQAGHHGVVLTRSGPLLVASQPILTTDGRGPARGTLVMGRRLDSAAVAGIGGGFGIAVSAYTVGSAEAQGISARTGIRLDQSGSAPSAAVLGPDAIAGLAVMDDVYGKPALLLAATTDRAVHRQGLNTAYVFGGLLSLACLLYALAFGMWLKANVLKRVESLSVQVSQVEGSGATSNMVRVDGADELAALANGINGMLARLEAAQRQTGEAHRRFETLFHELPEGCAVHEMIFDEAGAPIDYRFEMVNPAFEAITGMKAGDIVGRTVLDVLPATERFWIETYGNVVLTGEPARFEHYSGVMNRHYRVAAFRPSPGRFACVVNDITESKTTEERIRKLLDESTKSRTALLSLLEDQRRAADALIAREEETRRLLEQQTHIAALAMELGEGLTLVEVYRTMHRHLAALVEVCFFVVSTCDETDRLIRAEYAAYADRDCDVSQFPPIPLGAPDTGPQSRVIHSGEVLYTPDHRQTVAGGKHKYSVGTDGAVRPEEPIEADEEETMRSAVYLPMKLNGEVTGIIEVQSTRLDAYTEKDIELLQVLASVAAVAVRNARLRADLVRELEERTRAEEDARRHLEELERWQDVILDREDRVQDLKREVNALCRRLGEPVPYPSQEHMVTMDDAQQEQ